MVEQFAKEGVGEEHRMKGMPLGSGNTNPSVLRSTFRKTELVRERSLQVMWMLAARACGAQATNTFSTIFLCSLGDILDIRTGELT